MATRCCVRARVREIGREIAPVIVAVRVTGQETVLVIAVIVPAIAATGPAAAIVLAREIVPRVVEIAPRMQARMWVRAAAIVQRLRIEPAAALPPIEAVAAIAAVR